ncbi:MAG: transposase [Planctomycetota bacterium]|nr:transposase [Planctomycetota bacterium]
MAKPKSQPQLSLDSAHLQDTAAGIPDDHWSRRFYEHVFCAFDDAQFAPLYHEGGRAPISPALLAGITILQYMFKASDGAAVDQSVMRRDWRVALGRTDDWEGFCPTVLVDFRKRLAGLPIRAGLEPPPGGDQARLIFDAVLQVVRDLGLLSGRRRVRMDATHVVADVARLCRAEALQEAIRVLVNQLYDHYPELRQRVDFLSLYDRFGDETWLGLDSSGPERLAHLGRDAQALLAVCGEREAKGKQVLAQMLAENFAFPDDADPQPLAREERSKDHIMTPHEPDVRAGKKGTAWWLGDKVHIVETADEGQASFIVDVLPTDPHIEDSTVTEELVQRAKFAVPEADTMLADGGYASATNTRLAAAAGVDLVSPPRGNNHHGYFPAGVFEFDFERQVARCPAGCESAFWKLRGREISIRFRACDCKACPVRGECTSSKRGRSRGISKDYEQLVADRERAAGQDFAKLYRHRAPIEATMSHLVHDCGLRRSRFRGRPKRALHAIFAATALNVRRLLHCLPGAEDPHNGPAAAHFARFLAPAGAAPSAL